MEMEQFVKQKLNANGKPVFQIAVISALLLSSICISRILIFPFDANLDFTSNLIDSGTNCARYAEPTVGYSPIRDADNDSMDDIWESNYTFSPSDPKDAYLDPDQDGYTNIEEFEAGTHPGSNRSYPGVLHTRSMDFNCFFIAEMGLINDDDLLDILIRDPDERYFPYIPDFVMIQQSNHGFSLDYAIRYEFDDLVSISETLILADLNANWRKDLALIGLSDYIPGMEDQFIFSSLDPIQYRGILGEQDIFPLQHIALGSREVSFFDELMQWINSYYREDYFDSNAPIIATVPELVGLSWITDSSGRTISSQEPLPLESFPIECTDTFSRCSSIVADQDAALNVALDSLTIDYLPAEFELLITDGENSPNEDDLYFQIKADFSESSTIDLKDYSVFNQDALSLARNELQIILESGVMFYPSNEASTIYNMLSSYLGGTQVFTHSYMIPKWGTYYMDFKYTRDRNIVGSVQGVLSFVGDRYVRDIID